MNAGFISFCDAKYAPLMQVLIDGLQNFSDKPIEIFGINMSRNPFKNTNVVFRPAPMKDGGFNRICYMKIYASLNTNFDFSVMLDADMVPNRNVDELVTFAIANAKKYPLNAGHGKDPDNQAETMTRVGAVSKSMPYVHATYCMSKESKPFWEEAQRYVDEFIKIGFWPSNADETIINSLLWKYGVTKQMSTFDPTYQIFDLYKKGLTYKEGPLAGYYEGKHLTYHIFHGCKDVEKAKGISNELRNLPLFATTKLSLEVVG